MKPDNIIISEDGYVKILDFGLAKLIPVQVGSEVKTMERVMTQEGVIVGTVQYMSPEQAAGRSLDFRSDQFSLGSILYEMATGGRPFERETTAETLTAIIREEPDPVTVANPELSASTAHVIARCLSKDPAERYGSSWDITKDIHPEVLAMPARHWSRHPLVAVGALGFLASVLVMIFGLFASTPSSMLAALPLTTMPGWEEDPALSPNGNFVAFSAQSDIEASQDILVRNVDGGEPIRLADSDAKEFSPVWSPEGDEIAFLRWSKGAHKLVIKPALGGRERTVTTVRTTGWMRGQGVDWSPDGSSLALTDVQAGGKQAIFLLSLETGEKTVLTKPPPDVVGDASPTFSPDGKTLAFVRQFNEWGYGDLFVQSLRSSEARRVTSGARYSIPQVAWTADGSELLFVTGTEGARQLWRVPSTGGERRRVAVSGENILGFALSRAGERLVYVIDRHEKNLWRATGPAGGPPEPPQRWLGSTRWEYEPQFSPDVSRVAFQSGRTGHYEIWIANADGTDPMQLTNLEAECGNIGWSPDGRIVAFTGIVAGNADMYLVDSEGGNPRRFTDHPANDGGKPWFSRDGRFLYFGSSRSGDFELWKQAIDGGEPERMTFGGVMNSIGSEDDASFFFWRDGTVWNQAFDREPVRVLDGVFELFWDVWKGQIVYQRDFDDGEAFAEIYDPQTETSRRLGSLGDAASTRFGFDVSPDGTAILFTRAEREGYDLMLVDGFR